MQQNLSSLELNSFGNPLNSISGLNQSLMNTQSSDIVNGFQGAFQPMSSLPSSTIQPMGSLKPMSVTSGYQSPSTKSLDALLAQLNLNNSSMSSQVTTPPAIKRSVTSINPMLSQQPQSTVQIINAKPPSDGLMVFRGSAALGGQQASSMKVSSPEDAKIIAEVCEKYVQSGVQCNYGLLEQSLAKWKSIQTPQQYQVLMIEYLSDRAYLPTQRGLFSEVYKMDPLLTERLKIVTGAGIIPTDFGNIILPGGRMRLRGYTTIDKANQLLGLINNIDGLYATVEKLGTNNIITGINIVDTIMREKYLILNIVDTLSTRRTLFDTIIKVIS